MITVAILFFCLQKCYLLKAFLNDSFCPTSLEQWDNARQLCQCHDEDSRHGVLLQESVVIGLENVWNWGIPHKYLDRLASFLTRIPHSF